MQSLPQEKRCNACGETKPRDAFHNARASRDGLVTFCKVCAKRKYGGAHAAALAERRVANGLPKYRPRTQEQYVRHRDRDAANLRAARSAAEAKLGGHCAECGERDPRVLHIDHVHGGGCKDPRRGNRLRFYRLVSADTSGEFRLLCANCNFLAYLATISASPTPQMRNYARRRDECRDKLGGVCAWCGHADRRVLQIDHVNGGGRNDPRRIMRPAFHRAVLANTTGEFQLLCANCNWRKRSERSNESSGRPRIPKHA